MPLKSYTTKKTTRRDCPMSEQEGPKEDPKTVRRPIPEGVRQLAGVEGRDRMDTYDREKLTPWVKLRLLMEEAKTQYGRDPRTGGFAIVMRPRVALQLLIDAKLESLTNEIKLERPVIAGTRGADVVGFWQDIPVLVRSTVVDDNVHVVRSDKIPDSSQIDRRRAGELRLAAHAGADRLESLRGG